jgi:hypothetical protein
MEYSWNTNGIFMGYFASSTILGKPWENIWYNHPVNGCFYGWTAELNAN